MADNESGGSMEIDLMRIYFVAKEIVEVRDEYNTLFMLSCL
jgi:hypothetical protein